MVFCAQCGTPGEGRFCTECGARLADASAAQGEQGNEAGGSRSPHIGGVSSPTTSTSSGGTSGESTPVPARSNVRGVSGSTVASGTTTSGGISAPYQPPSGTSVGGTTVDLRYGAGSPIAPASSVSAGFVNQPAVDAPAQQQQSPTALFGSQGYRLDAFHHIAREIFVALDRSIQPVGTQMIEASKMRRFRELCGNPIPPYYESHVLPLYYQTIGAQCVGANTLSWDGWNTFLAHKILSAPDTMYAQLGTGLRSMNIQLPWPLARDDFPPYAYPDASAREMQFQQGIRDLAGSALGGGYGGGGVGGGVHRHRSSVGLVAGRTLMAGLFNSGLFN